MRVTPCQDRKNVYGTTKKRMNVVMVFFEIRKLNIKNVN